MDASGERHRGLLTGDDLAGWQATLEAPVTLDYHGHTICKTGPWGQGPVMLQQLALLAGFDLEAMGPGPDFVHTVVECAKLAFADREAWYGDPEFADVPLAALLSAEYADERRALVGERASEVRRARSQHLRRAMAQPTRARRVGQPLSSMASGTSTNSGSPVPTPRGPRTPAWRVDEVQP